jgi:hypothetical protein
MYARQIVSLGPATDGIERIPEFRGVCAVTRSALGRHVPETSLCTGWPIGHGCKMLMVLSYMLWSVGGMGVSEVFLEYGC